MIKVGIIGGAGYTAGELLRLLINHPEVEIVFVNSKSNAGNLLTDVHEGLYGETSLRFSSELSFDKIELLFFCTAHGDSEKFIAAHTLPKNLKIIDLAQDFRIKAENNDFVYGLPEMNKNSILGAKHIANPGCFATCIQLALLPLASAHQLTDEIHIQGITGSTGAGQKPRPTTHFSWRNNNMSVYKAFTHQHLREIRQSLVQLQPDFDQEISFLPMRGDFPRGIFVSAYIKSDLTEEEAVKLFKDYYAEAAFTHVIDSNLDMKQVVNTNKALVHVEKIGNKLLVLSAIDNLLKGASGQAVQNMNLICGFDEMMGLHLKSLAF